MLLKFRKTVNKDDSLNRLQQEVSKVLGSITDINILDGVLIDSITVNGQKTPLNLSTTTVLVPHGLGRAYQGFIVLDQDSAGVIYRDSSIVTDTEPGKANDKTKFIPLKASASVNAKVWVF